MNCLNYEYFKIMLKKSYKNSNHKSKEMYNNLLKNILKYESLTSQINEKINLNKEYKIKSNLNNNPYIFKQKVSANFTLEETISSNIITCAIKENKSILNDSFCLVRIATAYLRFLTINKVIKDKDRDNDAKVFLLISKLYNNKKSKLENKQKSTVSDFLDLIGNELVNTTNTISTNDYNSLLKIYDFLNNYSNNNGNNKSKIKQKVN
jgi:hypothetical protein